MWKCSVRVIDAKGAPRRGARVAMFGSGFLAGHLESHTASDGWADFSNSARDNPEWIVETIYINGEKVSGSVRIVNGQKLSFTL